MTVADDKSWLWQAHTPAETGPGQVRIKIAATALNRADLMQRQGIYPPPPGYSQIPGLECAGEIVEVGEGVELFEPGPQVCALLAAETGLHERVCGNAADEILVNQPVRNPQ